MKKKSILLAAVVLLVSLGFWGVLRKRGESSAPPTSAESQDQQHEKAASTRSPVPSSVATAPKASRSPVSEGVQLYVQNKMADSQYDWKQPINFYGKVVDESNQPVGGATVNFGWNDLSEQGRSTGQATSDAAGLFSLVNHSGKRLIVAVKKEGYYTSRQS